MTQKFAYGRKPPKNHPALALADIRTKLPMIPTEEDWIGQGGWEMLGNDRYGDCVAVTWANVRRVMGAKYPSFDDVITLYKTQNPGFPDEDYGMDIQTCLEYLVNHGGPDGTKALAFAKVDHTNVAEVKAAIAIFGYVWTGINVLDINQDEFPDKPWDYSSTSPFDGGHSVVTGGYGAGSGTLGGDERFITWAEETSFTDRYWDHQVEEAWVVIWPEHLTTKGFLEGVDQTKLASSYKELTGREFPVSPTPPTPVPPGPPVADPDRDLAVAQVAWETHEDNMKRRRSCDSTLELANRAWRRAKGY
jgi:hypothetical protein